jgi:hypothetical protein
MRYVHVALLVTVATALLPLATPAVAELRHPTGCLTCSPVEVPGAQPGATELTPETDTATAPKIGYVRRHARRAEVRHLGSLAVKSNRTTPEPHS